MPSVGDEHRRRTSQEVLALPVAARIAMALSLGDDDLSLFVRASGLEPDEARRRLCMQRASGRAPSVADRSSRR
jgi:hypothetical protein